MGGGWAGKKSRIKKRSSKTIDIVSYALKVSVSVMCVFVAHFRSSDTSESSSTKTCVTSNNLILHNALHATEKTLICVTMFTYHKV